MMLDTLLIKIPTLPPENSYSGDMPTVKKITINSVFMNSVFCLQHSKKSQLRMWLPQIENGTM